MSLKHKKNIGKRATATIIDYILTMTLTSLYIRTFGEYNSIDDSYSVHGYQSLLIIFYWLIYHVAIEYWFGGTYGHKMLGLTVKNEDGKKTRFWQNLKRHLLDPIDFIFFGIPALISANNTDKYQRLGDLWAKTIVVGKDFKIIKDLDAQYQNERD